MSDVVEPAEASGDRLATGVSLLTWGAFGAVTILAATMLVGSTGDPIVVGDSSGWIGFSVDRLSVLLLLLVTGVSATVQSYARRYLRAEPTQVRFVLLTAALTLGGAALVCAGTLVTVAAAWVVTGLVIVALAGLRPAHTASASDRRRIRAAFAIGDGSLVVATLIISVQAGTIALHDSEAMARGIDAAGGWALVAAVLVVVAAAARCALIPFSSGLPATLGAPTPVSALLHAGAVNGGGLLLIRLAPVLDAWAPSWYLAAGVGALTALWAAAVMSVTVDVKGSLVRSTSAQMGFMIVTVAAGLPAAAAVHLVAHGFYKAALFLGSGAVVHEITTGRSFPPTAPRGRRWSLDLLAAAAPAAAMAGAVVTLEGTGAALDLDGAKVALLCFAWATASVGLRGWLQRSGHAANRALATGAVALGSFAYVVGVATFSAFLSPSLATGTNGPGPLAFLPLAAGILVLLVGRSWIPVTSRLYRWAYVAVLNQSYVIERWTTTGAVVRRSTVAVEHRPSAPVSNPVPSVPRPSAPVPTSESTP